MTKASTTLTRFIRIRFLLNRTEAKYFTFTIVFVWFSPLHINAFSIENTATFFMFWCSLSIIRTKRPKTLMEAIVYDAFSFRHRFPKLTFSPIYNRNRAFLKRCVFQDSTFETVFKSPRQVFISVFGHFSADDRRTRIRKYAFLHLLSENLTMWHWIIYSSSKKRTHHFNTFTFILKTAIVIRPQFDWIVLTSNPTQQNLLVHLSQWTTHPFHFAFFYLVFTCLNSGTALL